MKISFNIFNRTYVIAFSIRIFKQELYGTTNKIYGLGHIIYLDYDRVEADVIEAEIEELQELFVLSDFYMFKTGNGYHAVCFDIVPLYIFKRILDNSSVDPKFRNMPMIVGKRMWTLRFSKKDNKRPEFIKDIPSKYSLYKKSKAHINFFEHIYPELYGSINRTNQNDIIKMVGTKYRK